MRVIFLDVDGVLNSNTSLEGSDFRLIDRNSVKLLKEITEQTGAVVVLSSGWKLSFDDMMRPLNEQAKYLSDVLCEFGIKLYGKTPDYSTEEIRKDRTFSKVKAKEISAWIDEHNDAENFIVLDDLNLNDEDINRRTVHISSLTGLTEHDLSRAVSMLTKAEWGKM